jgi:hypothetical protein
MDEDVLQHLEAFAAYCRMRGKFPS